MKIIMDKGEILDLLKRSFPKEMVPEGYEVTNIKAQGYPDENYSIIVEKKETEIS